MPAPVTPTPHVTQHTPPARTVSASAESTEGMADGGIPAAPLPPAMRCATTVARARFSSSRGSSATTPPASAMSCCRPRLRAISTAVRWALVAACASIVAALRFITPAAAPRPTQNLQQSDPHSSRGTVSTESRATQLACVGPNTLRRFLSVTEEFRLSVTIALWGTSSRSHVLARRLLCLRKSASERSRSANRALLLLNAVSKCAALMLAIVCGWRLWSEVVPMCRYSTTARPRMHQHTTTQAPRAAGVHVTGVSVVTSLSRSALTSTHHSHRHHRRTFFLLPFPSSFLSPLLSSLLPFFTPSIHSLGRAQAAAVRPWLAVPPPSQSSLFPPSSLFSSPSFPFRFARGPTET